MQRYDLVGEYDLAMAPVEHGTYVLYDDAVAALEDLRDALKIYAECNDGCTCGDGWDHKEAIDALAIVAQRQW